MRTTLIILASLLTGFSIARATAPVIPMPQYDYAKYDECMDSADDTPEETCLERAQFSTYTRNGGAK